MKRFIVTTMFLLLCAVFALAQTSSTTPSSNSGSQSGTSTSSGSTTGQDTNSSPSSSTSSGQSGQSTTGGSSTMGTGSTSGPQDMGPSNSSQTSASTKNHKEKKISGCLESAGSSGSYMIRKGSKDFAVIPSSAVSSEIASHVGHKVKLYGTWEEGNMQTAMNNSGSSSGSSLPQSDQPGSSSTTASGKSSSSGSMGTSGSTAGAGSGTDMGSSMSGKNAKQFRAERIEMVSDSCGGKKSSNNSSMQKP